VTQALADTLHYTPPITRLLWQVRTVQIAETMLPTRHGNFRLRGYKHSVRQKAMRTLWSRL
jgi:hypothetical protein